MKNIKEKYTCYFTTKLSINMIFRKKQTGNQFHKCKEYLMELINSVNIQVQKNCFSIWTNKKHPFSMLFF